MDGRAGVDSGGELMVSRQAAAVLKGAGLERWICSDGAEMVEQALKLANNHTVLEQQRLQQRQQVAASDLLDHPAWPQVSRTHFEAGGCDGCSSTAGPPMPHHKRPGRNPPAIRLIHRPYP